MNAVVAQPAAVPRQFAARSALRRNAGKAASAAPARARRSVAVRAAGNNEVRERYARLIRIERAGRDVEPRARALLRCPLRALAYARRARAREPSRKRNDDVPPRGHSIRLEFLMPLCAVESFHLSLLSAEGTHASAGCA